MEYSATLEWVKGKYKGAVAEWRKYKDLEQQFPFQYNRAKDNLKHWENVLYVLENMKEVKQNENT